MAEPNTGFDPSIIATGLAVFLTALGTAAGWITGKKKAAPPEPAKQVEIMGGIFDNRVVQPLMDTQERNTLALRENSEASRNTASGIAAIVMEVRHVVDVIKNVLYEVKAIREEGRALREEIRMIREEAKEQNRRLEDIEGELIRTGGKTMPPSNGRRSG